MVYKFNWTRLFSSIGPSSCLLSQQALDETEKRLQLSANSLKLFKKTLYPCKQCGLPLKQASDAACGICQKRPPAYNATICAFEYTEPLSQMIHAFKFNQQVAYAKCFGNLLADKIKEHYHVNNIALPELIIPVPLHIERLRQRGYNQSTELSKVLSKNLGLPYDDLAIKRLINTEEQSKLNAKQRRFNLKNAFALSKALNYKHVAIVDDVMTTGTTAEYTARTLKKAGLSKVDIWVLARRPKQLKK